ncbi:MAG: cellulase family glycosylhydrolase [Lachnospiraceae bacterium]|nr:cellulase family glycosylhydrolase [Lachnospiraceae bacterium]
MASSLKECGFYRGINLGGWMSQCDYSDERLDGFIVEDDFKRIADWGLDHVRIPVDYNVIQTADGSLKPEGFARLDRAIGWSEKYGLKTVLDLHKTQGFSFDAEEGEAGFFESEKYQKLFYGIWEALAKRYGTLSGKLIFELLNEVTDESYLAPWMQISRECVRRIRKYAPETDVLVGSYHHNGAREVQYLEPPFDAHVIYNFHCYEPLKFTHQGAHWDTGLDREDRFTYEESGASEEYFEALFAPAITKAAAEGTELYCGEYGVIDIVPPAEALKWFHAIHAVFEKHGIARAVWSYRQMDFGLADTRMDNFRKELLGCL